MSSDYGHGQSYDCHYISAYHYNYDYDDADDDNQDYHYAYDQNYYYDWWLYTKVHYTLSELLALAVRMVLSMFMRSYHI